MKRTHYAGIDHTRSNLVLGQASVKMASWFCSFLILAEAVGAPDF